MGGGQMGLTTPIKAFTDIVMRSAIQINVWKTGMKILADYKRRKDLKIYLPHSEHWKLKNDRKSLNKSAANLAMGAGESPASKRTISTSEDAEGAEGEPPAKRAAPAEEEKEVGKAEGGDGVESLGVGEEGDAVSEEAQIAGAE